MPLVDKGAGPQKSGSCPFFSLPPIFSKIRTFPYSPSNPGMIETSPERILDIASDRSGGPARSMSLRGA